MFQGSAFQPIKASGFLPQVRLAGGQIIQARQSQAFYPAVTMGQDSQTAQAWYERAKKAIDRYAFLKSRVAVIANKTEREAIITWLGNATVPGTPEYRFSTVKSDFTDDVAREGVGAYNVERRQGRIVELEEFNDDFDVKVKNAIQTYGELPAVPTQPGQQQAAAPDLTVPILVGAGVIALGLIFG